MKANKIELKPCYFVAGWATEIVKGLGAIIEVDDWGSGEQKVLFLNATTNLYNLKPITACSFNEIDAKIKLAQEKRLYKEYLIKTLKESNEKLQQIVNEKD